MNPYPGLRPYRQNETLFGREERIDELVWLLQSERFVAVTGVSGSGKSSLVRAGLTEALICGRMPVEQKLWKIAVLTPGAKPLANLARALRECGLVDSSFNEARLESGGNALVEAIKQDAIQDNEHFALLLIIDQFEELFLSARQNFTEVEMFLDLLLAADSQRSIPFYLTLTMRSDYIGEAAKYRGLPELINRSNYLVPRMTPTEMNDAIEKPARSENAAIERQLVEVLRNETRQDPSRLPLLQHALRRMWDLWESLGSNGCIGFEHYNGIGTIDGVDGQPGALHLHAESVYQSFGPQDRLYVERLFCGIVECSSDGRVAKCAKTITALEYFVFATADSDEVWRPSPLQQQTLTNILATLREHSFIRSIADQLDPDYVDLSHETLITAWGTLRSWITNEAKQVTEWRWISELERRNAEDDGNLLRGKQIVAAQSLLTGSYLNRYWIEAHRIATDGAALIKRISSYVDASVASEEAERRSRAAIAQAQAQAQAERRKLIRIAVLAVCSLIVIGSGAIATLTHLSNKELKRSEKGLQDANEKLRNQASQDQLRAKGARERSRAVLEEASAYANDSSGKNVTLALRLSGFALRLDPGNTGAIKLACKLLAERNWCVPVSPTFAPPANSGYPLASTFAPTGELIGVFSNGALFSGDESTGQWRLKQLLLPTEKTAALRPPPNIHPSKVQRGEAVKQQSGGSIPAFISATFSDDARSLLVFHLPLAATSEPPTCQVWTWADGSYVEKGHSLNLRDRSPFRNVQWSKDGRTFFIGRYDASSAQVFHWEYTNFDWEKTGSLQRLISSDVISAAGFSGEQLATVSFDQSGLTSSRVKVFNTTQFETGNSQNQQRSIAGTAAHEWRVPSSYNGRPTQLTFLPSGRSFLLGSWGMLPKLFNLNGTLTDTEPALGSSGGNDIPMRIVFSSADNAVQKPAVAAVAYVNRIELMNADDLTSRISEPISVRGTAIFPSFSWRERKLATLSGSSWLSLESVRAWMFIDRNPSPFDPTSITDDEIAPPWLADLSLLVSGQGGGGETGDSSTGTSELQVRSLGEFKEKWATKPVMKWESIFDRFTRSKPSASGVTNM